MPSLPPLHIAIVGYGTAGQAAALLLARDGHRVEVFERAPAPGPVGAGFLLQPTGLGVLQGLGLLQQVLAHGAPVRRLLGHNAAGRIVMDMHYADLHASLHGVGLQRGALFEVLHGALQEAWAAGSTLHTGQAVTAVEPEAGRLCTQDGRWHGPYDLVIAADGSASALRHTLGPPALDRPYPWGALWCLVPAGDWPHVNELRQRYRGARQMIGLLPVGTRPGDSEPRLSFFWSLPVDEFGHWEARGLEAFRVELEALWPEAASTYAPIFGPDGARPVLARAGYRDAVLRHWHRGRLVVIGDAAHAMSPQLGQGVNMALMDAWALRDALRATPHDQPAALHRYARERRRHVAIYHFWSRWLTPLFQSRADRLAALRDLLFHPLGRLPLGRGHMLRVLSGTQQGWLGRLPLDATLAGEMARAPAQRLHAAEGAPERPS